MSAPVKPSHLHVAYFQADGTVVHLVQSDANNLFTYDNHTKLLFGDGREGRPTFRVKAPFGPEMVVVIGRRAHRISDEALGLGGIDVAWLAVVGDDGVARVLATASSPSAP